MMNIPNLATFYNAPFPIVRASSYTRLFFRPKPSQTGKKIHVHCNSSRIILIIHEGLLVPVLW